MEQALRLGKIHGYRNSQATVLAPTGTIGLLMDCDTTGIEPDFALVKFKKLAGGGYFKIINQSVTQALKKLGYDTEEIQKIIKYIVGTLSLENAPHINRQTLKAKGFSYEDIQKIETALPATFELKHAFNRYNVSEETLAKLKIHPESTNSLLETLGFTKEEIDTAEEEICGHMTVEGCPTLKEEHLPVFDCA